MDSSGDSIMANQTLVKSSNFSMYVLVAVLIVSSCQPNMADEIPDAETERAQAFMSGKVMINGNWQTSPFPRNLIGHDYSAGMEMFDEVQAPILGMRYIAEMSNIEMEPKWWKEQWIKAEKILADIKQLDHACSAILANYEMVAFTMIKYYLNKVEPNAEMASVSASLLDLLLKSGTLGELDLLAENLMRISRHLSQSEVDTLSP